MSKFQTVSKHEMNDIEGGVAQAVAWAVAVWGVRVLLDNNPITKPIDFDELKKDYCNANPGKCS